MWDQVTGHSSNEVLPVEDKTVVYLQYLEDMQCVYFLGS